MGCGTASLPSTHQMPAATPAVPRQPKTVSRPWPLSRGAASAQAEIHCGRQPMMLRLGENGWAKSLLSHTMASLAIERKPPHPLKQSCDFHVPAGTSLASQVFEGSEKAQRSGSAPVVRRQPCEAVGTGRPDQGPRGADSRLQLPRGRAPFSDLHRGTTWVSSSPAGQSAAVRFLLPRFGS